MSISSRLSSLEREVAELRVLVSRLAAQLEDSEGSSFDLVPPSTPTPAQPSQHTLSPPPANVRSRAAFSPAARATASTSASPAGAASTSSSSRGAACREIGLFLHRCLAEEHRGQSGRDRLPGGSRFWVVARDYSGVVFSPVQVFSRFADCKQIVKVGSDLGESVSRGT